MKYYKKVSWCTNPNLKGPGGTTRPQGLELGNFANRGRKLEVVAKTSKSGETTVCPMVAIFPDGV